MNKARRIFDTVRVSTQDGPVIINPYHITRVVEAGVSGKWHDTKAYIHMDDGHVIESRTSVEDIDRMWTEALDG